MHKNIYGFTLIELLVTIAIIVIILSITVSSINFYDTQLIKAELSNLEMNINYLATLSRVKRNTIVLNFDTNRYTFENIEQKLNQKVKFGFIKGAKGPPSNPTKNINKAITFDKSQILFEPKNISSGIIYLIDNSKKYMFALSISVAKKQFIRKYQYLNKKWILLA